MVSQKQVVELLFSSAEDKTFKCSLCGSTLSTRRLKKLPKIDNSSAIVTLRLENKNNSGSGSGSLNVSIFS